MARMAEVGWAGPGRSQCLPRVLAENRSRWGGGRLVRVPERQREGQRNGIQKEGNTEAKSKTDSDSQPGKR